MTPLRGAGFQVEYAREHAAKEAAEPPPACRVDVDEQPQRPIEDA
ncbi:hypothetical protein [Acrocarpospora macrocephala]|nr:hypothetical protein [Acrocarpospora macrocephala]